MRIWINIVVSIILIGGAAGVAVLLVKHKPKAEVEVPERIAPTVEIVVAEPIDTRLRITSQGTVMARTETDLAAEVSGRIVEVSPNFRPGGFFSEGEMLVRIDPADYRAIVAARKAELAGAELALAQEIALADQSANDWENLGRGGEPSSLTLRKPQLAQARANVDSAKANLEKAERDLDRTEIRAPYDGRVLEQFVDLGQFVSAAPAAPLARIFARDFAEVRLPITDREAGQIVLPVGADTDPDAGNALPAVTLRATLGGRDREWTGRIVRVEATIDPRSRLLYAVAAIEDPFARKDGQLPLQRGLFVHAEIEGVALQGVFAIPRYALRDNDSVYVMTPDNTLVSREVEVLHTSRERAVIGSGLEAGDRIAISPIAYFVEGMPVTLANREP